MSTDDKAPTWKSESARQRVYLCKAMLYIHGFLTEAENCRVEKRILKWVDECRALKREES